MTAKVRAHRARRAEYGLALGALAALVTLSRPAAAEFAQPPPREPLQIDEDSCPHCIDAGERGKSTMLRLGLGPALRASDGSAGLLAALDIGPERAGFRGSAAWIGVGSNHGLAQYAGELWVDVTHALELHPILAAGAGLARLERRNASSGKLETDDVGIALMSARLEYQLPIAHADARAGLGVSAALPAIAGSDAGNPHPWLLAVATLGVGF